MNNIYRIAIRDFQLTATCPNTQALLQVSHNKQVEYLGVHLDQLLRGNVHLEKQIKKSYRGA